MKRYLFIIIISIFSLNCFSQDRDGTMTIDDTLFVNDVFKYLDTIIPVTDITYHEFSTDNIAWTKDTTGANWVRFSNDVKNTWWVLPYSAFETYWQVENDTLKPFGDYVVGIDSAIFEYIDSKLYLIEGDTLAITDLNGGDGTEGQTLIYVGGSPVWQNFPAGVGETNVMSNVGANGIGIYDAKVGVQFNMRNIDYDSDSLITVTLNAPDSTIELGFDGTKRYIATTNMISGGGDLSVSRTHTMDIPSGVETTVVDKNDDFLAIYDASLAAHRKVNPELFQPDIYVNQILEKSNANYTNYIEGDGIDITFEDVNSIRITATGIISDDSIQVLTGSLDTLDLDIGTGATHTMTGVDTIFIDNLSNNVTGNITITCRAANDSLLFLGGTVKLSPFISSVNGVIPTTNGAGATDVYSYWWDGLRLIINGTQNYD